MHSRKKRTQPPTPEEIAKEKARLQKMQELHTAVFASMEAQDLSTDAFDLTTRAIRTSSDIYTFFNYRRQILLKLFEETPEDQLPALLKKELDLLGGIIKESPKSYTLWFHRQWILQRCKNLTDIMERELKLCEYMLNKDNRNFHCWDYRTWFVKFAGTESLQDELLFTDSMILRDFSNFSAWHYRTKVVKQIYTGEIPDEFVRSELGRLKNAYFTCPMDQSIWNYHRWLLNQKEPIMITGISPREFEETPKCFIIGFSHNIKGINENSIGVSQGWEPLQGTWEPLYTQPFSYIWKFTPSQSAPGDIEFRLSPINTELTDINGHKKLTSLQYKFKKTENKSEFSVEGQEDATFFESELESIDELLRIEEDDRSQAVLRKAQLLETLSFMNSEKGNIDQIIASYQELIRIDYRRAPFYRESLSVYNAIKNKSAESSPIVSRKMLAKILGFIDLNQ
ncbi:unnamed protein product [Blepharisma stoltei]|uniref:Geranylgeranyl transferase type-2 subunit alpha n=1 Tax=Blepharisma stoltei TaxID=1481888 RepID=A0AAU9IIZ7_9CILI|nr:unnamed protein product [Blepharisma stoltei]